MRTLTLLVLSASLTACTPNLLGKWTGELDCGPGASFDVEVDLDTKAGKTFSGSAVLEDAYNCVDGACDLEFDVEFTVLDGSDGVVNLDADLDDCAVVGPSGSETVNCGDLDDMEFRNGMIEGKFEEPGVSCDVELAR